MKRKPFFKRLQFFFPWNSPYLGVQWDNRFYGVGIYDAPEP